MKMYLIGVKPQLPVEEAEALIKAVDFCGVSLDGEPVRVGSVLRVPFVLHEGDGKCSKIEEGRSELLVVGVEHGGRVATVVRRPEGEEN